MGVRRALAFEGGLFPAGELVRGAALVLGQLGLWGVIIRGGVPVQRGGRTDHRRDRLRKGGVVMGRGVRGWESDLGWDRGGGSRDSDVEGTMLGCIKYLVKCGLFVTYCIEAQVEAYHCLSNP